MLPVSLMLLLFFPAALFVAAQGAGDLQGFTFPGGNALFDHTDPCMAVYPPCMSEADRFSLEALRSIHQMMDDDKDGGIEVEESVEFIIEDMKQQQTHKHSNLHREDQHITIEELWSGWKSSIVHNWTQEEVLCWLKEFVELPQYERNFKDFKVNGNTLPRIAANEPSFLSGQLRVQDQRDKQKLNIKALDVVLFGPPTRPPHNYMKDLLLIVSVVMGIGGCWFARVQNKTSKVHVARMMKDLESLQRAEQSLTDMQEQLEQAQEEKRNVAEEKQNLEDKMRDEIRGAQNEAYRLHTLRQGAVSELSRLRYAEEELEQVLGALKQAEMDMHASWSASEALQQWLQLTHEVEVQYYNVKRHSAELQLASAKEEAEKIKKKRSSVLGTLHVAHSSSLDQVDQKILQAKNALSDVTSCLRERLHRWQQVEHICGFPIIRNPGLVNLTAELYSDSVTLGVPRNPQSPCSCQSSMHGSMEDLLEAPCPSHPMPVPVPPKRSPRTQGSTIIRQRGPPSISQPPAAMNSPDPDLLVQIRAPYPCPDEDQEHFRKTLKKIDSQERFSETDYMSSSPLSKRFSSFTVDTSSQKLCHDEPELLSDCTMARTLSKELEAVVESPVRKITLEELEASMDCRKMAKDKGLDASMEIPSFKISKEESLTEAASRKISRDRGEVPLNVSVRKGMPKEFDVELSARRAERDATDDPRDSSPRIISRDMMGSSMDSASRRMMRDDVEHPFDSRRITRDSRGMSFETLSRKLPRNNRDCQLDSPVRAFAMDTMVPTRKISREELEYCADAVSMKMLTREKFEALIDTSSPAEEQEYGPEPSMSRRLLRDELEMSSGTLRRRTPRVSREETESYTDTPEGKTSWVEVPIGMHKQSTQKDYSKGVSESSAFPARVEQPDLTATSQWQSSADLRTAGPLSKLVYDGILEKSCNSMASISPSISASTPNLPQMRLQAELEPPVPPPRNPSPSPQSPRKTGDERHKDKEKNRKTLSLKNLFKKKSETTSEKLQSGLQKL